jgi:glycosyltransferase involved in cell wall biosynthesis
MHILVLSDFFPPQLNAGAENIALELSNGYIKKGNKVSVITINKSLNKGELFIENKKSLTCYQIGYNYNEKFSGYLGLYNPIVLRIIHKIILENSFDLAHIHNIHKYISYGVISLLKKHSISAILTVHDTMLIDYGKYDQGVNNGDISLDARVSYKASQFKIWRKNWKRYNPFKNIFIKHQFKKLRKIVCVSRELEKFLNANGILNTLVIHNGIVEIEKPTHVNIEKFKNKIGIDSNDKILLFAGRISEAKGFLQVQILLSKLIQKDKNIKLLIVGKKIKFDNIIEKNIINIGWLSKQEMTLAYSISKITLVPSVYLDPFPTVVLESMRLRRPVIVSVYSGAQEAVNNGVNGYHVNPFDIDDFLGKILRILNNSELSQFMSSMSEHDFKKKFTLENSVNQYLKLLNNK